MPGYSADAVGATITPECLQHPQRRRWSATRGAYPKCAQACGTPGVCVLWWCSRPGRAPRRTGMAAEAMVCFGAVAAAEYVRHDVCFGALCEQPASRVQTMMQQVSVSLLAADVGAAFCEAASVLPAGGAWTIAASLLGSAPREGIEQTDSDSTFTFDQTE